MSKVNFSQAETLQGAADLGVSYAWYPYTIYVVYKFNKLISFK